MSYELSYPGGMAPPPAAAVPPHVPVPREVLTAIKLWIASIVVGVVSSILTYTLTDPYTLIQRQSQRNRAGRGSTLSQSHTFVTIILVMGAVVAVLGIAVELFFLFKMRAGRNWARIVLTVWAGLSVAGTVLGVVFELVLRIQLMPISLVAGGLSVVLLGIAVMFMYRPAANTYCTPVQEAVSPPNWWQQPPSGQQPYAQQPYGQRTVVVAPSSYAWWPTRALSGLIDYGIPTVIFFFFYLPFTAGTHGMGGTQGLLIMLSVIVVLVAFQIWNSGFRQGRTGQSWGKQVAKTQLIDERTGQPLGAGKAFLRLLTHVLDSAPCYLGWLFPLWDRPKRQTFADKIMHSIVIPVAETPQQGQRPRGLGQSPQQGHGPQDS